MDQSESPSKRRSHRWQWIMLLTTAFVLLVTYAVMYVGLTRVVTPPGHNRARVFPSAAVRTVWSPLYWAERKMTGIDAAVTDEFGTTTIEDEWEVIVIDTDAEE